jgi:transcription antitermination factor NusG
LLEIVDGATAGATPGGPATSAAGAERWHVLWTRSHFEQSVSDQLARKGFDVFLPKVNVWSRRRGLRHVVHVPMFAGYLFVNHAMDKASYIEVCKAQGLVRMLGERWDRLATVPERDIEAIRRIVASELPARPHAYLRDGQRVRITRGPLTDLEGVLVRSKPTKGLLVVSVHMLQRSVAVEVDCTIVEAA